MADCEGKSANLSAETGAVGVVVGFTGTRKGMTRQQMVGVGALLRSLEPRSVHHGDCVGADADFDMLAHLVAQYDGTPDE